MRKAIVFLAIILPAYLFAASPLQPAKLTVEYLENPLGIDIKSPRFSWMFTASQPNQHQSAYELIVSDNLNDIKQGKGTIWSTGKINSDQSLHIDYKGNALQSFTRYYWRVKVYNKDGEASNWSDPAWFETAMLSENDWKANWISDGSVKPAKDEDYYQPDRMPLFRKEFSAGKKIASARLYISGMGYYEAYLNGKKISDHVLDPGWTTYGKQVLYVVHDVTALVKKGNNVAGIMLGNGWWNPLPFKLFGRWDLREYQQTGRPCVKAEFHVKYTDGTSAVVPTDASWQTAPGPIVRNNVYLGETYDARLEQKNWNTDKTDKANWKNASVATGPSGTLTVQMQPPIRVTKVVKPVAITSPAKDTFIVDMGQNFAGVAKIKVSGPAGTKITIRLGEGVFANGSINLMTTVATQIKKGGIKAGPGAPETAWQEDSYILKGEGIEEWSPKFTFHGFRYIEITGWPGTPTVNDFEGLRMNSDMPLNGTFSCSNDMFNKLHEVIQWTFLSNVFSVQSDCPGREKMGYGADMVVSANAFLYNYDMANFYRKAVKDFANEQRPQGGITEIAPFTGIADRGYGDLSGPLGWQLAFPFVQQQLYHFYGDKRIIEEYYPAFKKQMEFLQSQDVNGLFYWDISDHEALEPKPESLTASAFYYHHAQLAADFAGILGMKEDSVRYGNLARNIKRTIINHFFIPNTGRFDNATQAAQLFGLWYDLSPEKDKSLSHLLQELERHNWHLTTGIFATQQFFDVMRNNNRNDVAYKVVNQRDYPGWGYMLDKGATTLWESWYFPETGPSRNHPMFGSVDEWFYRSLLGINATAPGFAQFEIKPQPAGDLTWAKGSYQSVRGTISSDWKIEGNKFLLTVAIPANTNATIYVPSKENVAIIQNNKPVPPVRYENGYIVVEAGSGIHTFQSVYK